MTKKITLLIVLMLSLQSCVSASKSSKLEYLVGIPKNISEGSKIEANLLRGTRTDTQIVHVVPYTQPLIYAEQSEEARKQGLDSVATEKLINEQLNLLTKDKQYFRMIITAPSYPRIDAKYIHGELVDSYGKSFPIHIEVGTRSEATTVSTYSMPGYVSNGYYYQGTSFSTVNNTTVAGFLFSVDTKVDFTQSFKINMDLRYDKDAKPFTLEWKTPTQ